VGTISSKRIIKVQEAAVLTNRNIKKVLRRYMGRVFSTDNIIIMNANRSSVEQIRNTDRDREDQN
jgi:hypothetical protein